MTIGNTGTLGINGHNQMMLLTTNNNNVNQFDNEEHVHVLYVRRYIKMFQFKNNLKYVNWFKDTQELLFSKEIRFS